jgi:hypothetical protein
MERFFLFIVLVSISTEFIYSQTSYTAHIRVEDCRWKQWADYNSSLEWEVDLWGDLYDPIGNKVPESEYSLYTFEWYLNDTGNWVHEGSDSNHLWCDGDDEQYYNAKLRISGNGIDVISDSVEVGKTGPAQKYMVKEFKQSISGYSIIPSTQFKYFTNPHWSDPPNSSIGGDAFILTEDANSYIKVQPYELTQSGQKFSHWNTQSDILNFDSVFIPHIIAELDAHFRYRRTNINIQANFPEVPEAEILGFKDPWLVDLLVSEDLGMRNQGDLAPFKYYNSINLLDPTFSDYKGVLLNQSGPPDWIPPYYSISIPSTINLPGNGGIHNIYLQSWDTSDARLQYPASLTTGVVFIKGGASITANLKATGLSNDEYAYSSNNQGKFIRTADGNLHKVYESMGHVWYEMSTDNGQNWMLQNNHQPLDDGGGENPSIDWVNINGTHQYIVIVFQQNEPGVGFSYSIQAALFGGNEAYPWVDTKTVYSTPFYQQTHCETTPVIAAYPAYDCAGIGIVWHTNEGLMLKNGSITLTSPQFHISDSAYNLAGTDVNSINPSLSTYKASNFGTYYLVFEQSNSILYSSLNVSGAVSLQTISTGDGFSKRNNPSIVVMDDHSAKVVWRAERNYYLDGGISIYRQTAVIFKDPEVEGFNQFGSNVGNPNINRSDNGSFFAFAWSENDGATIKFADNNLSSYWTMPNNTGKDVQISNGSNKFAMYAESFNSSAVPHYFKTSPNLASMQYETPVIHGTDGPAVGREGTISAGHAQFFFNFGDISVADSSIGFIPLPQHPSYDSVEVLNEYSLTEAFNIYDGIDFMYTILYGTTDSTGAAALLVDGNYVSYSLYLVDDATGEVIAPLDNVVFEEGNIFQYANIRYQLETTGLGNRRVRMKLAAANNFEAEYSLNESYTDESETLGKALIKKKKAIAPMTEYAVAQNFPNPFNPATTINYQIPQTGFVTLKIYDILGKEITTLVNEQKNQGRYSVNFDASKLASGVYIYQLRVNDYVSSKKMLLLK